MARILSDVPLGARIRHKMHYADNDEPSLQTVRTLFVCDCGSRLFELHPHGAVCVKCFTTAEGW